MCTTEKLDNEECSLCQAKTNDQEICTLEHRRALGHCDYTFMHWSKLAEAIDWFMGSDAASAIINPPWAGIINVCPFSGTHNNRI